MTRSFILFALCSLVGCGAASDGRRAVSGEVSFQRKPLDLGAIEFSPKEGSAGPAAGAMIREGKYAIPVAQGLKPGIYRVAITSPKPGPPVQANPYAPFQSVERVNARFNAESRLVAEVVAGSGAVEFSFDVE